MSQEYYAVEKETNLGALNIGLNVFQSIAVKTVESIDGGSLKEICYLCLGMVL